MSIVDFAETYLTKHIEGFFNKRFAGDIEPAELKRLLGREVAAHTDKTEDGRVFAPSLYEIYLPAKDYGRLCSERMIAMLKNTVRREVIKNDLFLADKPEVFVKKNTDEENDVLLVSRFVAPQDKPAKKTPDGTSAQEFDDEQKTAEHTIVLERHKFKNPLNLPVEDKFATLTVTAGINRDFGLEIGLKKIFIGRAGRSDFILTDDTVSRIHAVIEYRNGRHFLSDENSANGTKLNGERISAPVALKSGDEVQLGNTAVCYEVM